MKKNPLVDKWWLLSLIPSFAIYFLANERGWRLAGLIVAAVVYYMTAYYRGMRDGREMMRDIYDER